LAQAAGKLASVILAADGIQRFLEEAMKAKLRKVGRSTALVIPKSMLRALAVKVGDEVDVSVRRRSVVLTRGKRYPREGWAEASKALSDEASVWDNPDKDWVW
jgi:antitoxin MazE